MQANNVIEILIATGNPSKAREITAVLSQPLPDEKPLAEIRWTTLKNRPSPILEPQENQESFSGNAALKARYYSLRTGLWTLADDSGLQVDALGGSPGVNSARYATHPEDATRKCRDAANNRKLIDELLNVPAENRSARFRCAMALADGDRILATAEGVIEGQIIDEPRGQGGFGYDPYFLVPDLGRTTAELTPAHKNQISHRGQALREMQEKLRILLRERFSNTSR